MEKKYFIEFKLFILFLMIFSQVFSVNAQKEIGDTDKIVFVYVENYDKNYIVIPNFGKLYKFKIYRKLKTESDYQFVVEKKRPSIALRDNWPGTWSVRWEDPDFHSREVDYQIFAFDKSENQLCEMDIVWEKNK